MDLRPSMLDDLGLLPSLRSLVEDFGRRYRIEATLDAPASLPPLPAEGDVALYRIIQEALTNVARHASARAVRVGVTVTPEGIRLAVQDDGAGANEAPVPRLGLLGIRERVVALGGKLALTTGEGTGFCLEATIPRAGAG